MSEKCHLSPLECESIGLNHDSHSLWEQEHICRVILKHQHHKCCITKYKTIYQLVEKHNLPLTKLIKLFDNTNISGYYKWLKLEYPDGQYCLKNRNKECIKKIYDNHAKHIGCRKIASILKEQYNIKLNYKTINQYMNAMCLTRAQKNHSHK
ncbi:transposase [Ureaplasma miroungigenitalium]|uniref:Transposase n=1 Tax=Ureaplasma miroungigenitalium TaxID=1042321 RepID=A0ABT3BLZ5_9BACT|nr:transposase [Ureaplasma miroungigenitalium]MCV3728269.1 transposase [Ureaplasma miroungigenitalium]MCV3734074.1 transposase [Ureaplasma miroungigenitalium]